jgi:hypothetical protein
MVTRNRSVLPAEKLAEREVPSNLAMIDVPIQYPQGSAEFEKSQRPV